MLAPILLKSLARSRTNVIRRESLVLYRWLGSEASEALLSKDTSFMCVQRQSHRVLKPVLDIPFSYRYNHGCQKSGVFTKRASVWYTSKASVEVETASGVVRFSLSKPREAKDSSSVEGKSEKDVKRRVKMSKKAKINQLKLYRLMARKKMNSPNPEVRIRYKLEKAKRKETWLIEKLRKFDVPKAPLEVHDPEILTEEEKHYLKRTGEKKKHYVLVGRRGVFGGVVLNMHLHWKNHETVKVICRPCKPGQLQEYAEELGRLSKGIVIDIKSNSTIIFYRGKNYVQPEVMSPPDTLSKAKALEKYKYLQSLEHTSQFIEKLEKELEEYQDHLAKYKQRKESENAQQHSLANP